MDQADEQDNVQHIQQPLLKVTTFGEFTLEQLLPSLSPTTRQSRYIQLHWEDVSSRGTALMMLKILLCSSDRRATKEELIAAMWDSWSAKGETIKTTHVFDNAASLLRRRILRTYDGESLLITLKGGGETVFKLPPQPYLWVDADAFLTLASQATLAEQRGDDPLPYLDAAHTLARGEFLDEELHYKWSQGKRFIIRGARRRVLYKLVELYSHTRHTDRAEELLFTFLVDNPTDEDALCQLMLLLAAKERRHEALNIYQYVTSILQDEKREPANYTQSVARQIQQGLSLQEGRATYSTMSTVNTHDLLTFPLIVHKGKGSFSTLIQQLQRICQKSRQSGPFRPFGRSRPANGAQMRLALHIYRRTAVYYFLVAWRTPTHIVVA
ncbi:MAG: hypothetical protein PVSMB5_19130 [Ktedonobacteraceae bacterium]